MTDKKKSIVDGFIFITLATYIAFFWLFSTVFVLVSPQSIKVNDSNLNPVTVSKSLDIGSYVSTNTQTVLFLILIIFLTSWGIWTVKRKSGYSNLQFAAVIIGGGLGLLGGACIPFAFYVSLYHLFQSDPSATCWLSGFLTAPAGLILGSYLGLRSINISAHLRTKNRTSRWTLS